MKLFQRKAAEWQDKEAKNRAWAHLVLDLLLDGEKFDNETIESALRITGDLL